MASDLEQELWRPVRSKPKCEHLAAQFLRREGFMSYAPRFRYQKRTQRGRVWFVEALFPGYVFTKFSLLQTRHVCSVQCVSGVIRFVEELGPVPEEVILDLQDHFPEETLHSVSQGLQLGQKVEVAEGTLRGMQAEVSKVIPGTERVRILFDFLGGKRETELPLSALLGFDNPRALLYPPEASLHHAG
jgi:transcriptional antiterminator RfaH